jgi:tyrosyl-tRNA synthetase
MSSKQFVLEGLLADLGRRGLIVQSSDQSALGLHLAQPRTVYCGFDPTADSLHIGSLVPLMALRRFQLAGHRPVALVGGATGLVGDPSHKIAERKLNPMETVLAWTERIAEQVSAFLDFSGPQGAVLVNNLEWFKDMPLLEFLRDTGKHFSVNAMIGKDSVRQRIEREGEGISYAEFTYMILQAYDFAELNRRMDCTVQIGGSDQWGNITGGIDLCRRQNRVQVHALTFPLVTKADGTKFGKTEGGTVWLSPERTSPYAFYQFWINTSDADVYRFMRLFTLLPVEEIDALEAAGGVAADRRQAQATLAQEVTQLVHGSVGFESAVRITSSLFAEDIHRLGEADLRQLAMDGLPCTVLNAADLTRPLTALLVEAGMATNGSQVKDALSNGAVAINGYKCVPSDLQRVSELFNRSESLYGRYFLVRLGRKKHHLFDLAPQTS